MDNESFFKRNYHRGLRLLFHGGRVARLRRYRRYWGARRQLRIAEREMAEGVLWSQAYPVYMNLDTGPVCNLRCRFCNTVNGIGNLKKELLTPDTFKRIVQNLPLSSLYEVGLFNWGEPLLNPHLLDYIRFFARKGIRVVIHTNFSVRDHDEQFMEALILSGIAEVTVSADGASQEVYEKYRVGGDFKRVIGNMELLAKTRRRLESDTPEIVYKMLLSRYNQHEIDDARSIAESLGVRFLVQENLGMPEQDRAEWTASQVLSKYGARPVSNADCDVEAAVVTECRQMWDTLVVNADGAVFPCCLVCSRDSALGNLTTQSFEDIWNGEKMRTLRAFVLDGAVPAPGFPNSCADCWFRDCTYRRQPRNITPE